MSDYLNSLVVRTLHSEPVVQPRLASWFEPLSPVGMPESALADESSFEAPEYAESESEISQTPLPTQISQQPLPQTVSAPRQKKEPNNESVTSNAPSAFIQPSPTLLPTQVIPQSALFKPDPSIQEIPNDEQVTPHFPTTVSAGTTDNFQNRRRINPEVRRRSTAPTRQENHAAPTIPEQHPVLTYAAPPAPVSSSRRASAQPSAPVAEPETVVVTIGRVDVRAIFPPPTTAPRSNRTQTQSPMSLDDYLKQRSEGRR